MRKLTPFLFLVTVAFSGCAGKDDSGDDTSANTDDSGPLDTDGDGVPDDEDCAPEDPYTYQGANEIPYDGIDNDCMGDGDITDWDEDGYDATVVGGEDCNDGNPTINPAALEICYDDIDQDCAGDEDTNDCDGDGFDRTEDCSDYVVGEDGLKHPGDPEINPDAEEVWYDGVDQDCSGPQQSDYDADGDGLDSADYGGDDCDDTNPEIGTGEEEHWDRTDRDCDGIVDKLNQRDADLIFHGQTSESEGGLGHSAVLLDSLDGSGLPTLAIGGIGSEIEEIGFGSGGVYLLALGDTEGAISDLAFAHLSSSEDYAGWDMASAGDLDGDGFEELAVGGPLLAGSGAVEIYSGADIGSGSFSDVLATLSGNTYIGADVAAMGDLDGDGFNELAAGADWIDTTSVRVFAGSDIANGGSVSDALAVIEGTGFGGRSLGVPDLNGDGVPELLVGDDTESAGSTVIVDGQDIANGGTLDVGDQITLWGWTGNFVGMSQGWLNDVDGNGYIELLVNAEGDEGLYEGSGIVYVLDASELGSSQAAGDAVALLTVEGSTAGGHLRGAESPGDYDADGVSDLVVSHVGQSPFLAAGANIQNSNFVFLGTEILANQGGVVEARDGSAEFQSTETDTQLGWVVLPRDLDDDGDDDLVLTGPWGQSTGGYAVVFTSFLGDE